MWKFSFLLKVELAKGNWNNEKAYPKIDMTPVTNVYPLPKQKTKQYRSLCKKL